MSNLNITGRQDYFNGIKIVTSHYLEEFKPKFKLENNVLVSPEFRKQFNNWLIEIFGKERFFLVLNQSESIAMHPNNKEFVKRKISDMYNQI